MKPKFLIHTKKDYVGVAVDDIKREEDVEGVYMDDNTRISIKAMDDIPLGHKIALVDIKKGSKVIEYGEPVALATADIRKGEHVHVHNVKSLRW